MARTTWSVDESRLTAALSALVDRVRPARVIAFGSRTRVSHHTDSDLDLAILYDSPPSSDTVGDAWETFAAHQLPVDLINVSTSVHDTRKQWLNSVHRAISEKGVVLYDVRSGFADHAVAAVARR